MSKSINRSGIPEAIEELYHRRGGLYSFSERLVPRQILRRLF
jgi:hypothetical protein